MNGLITMAKIQQNKAKKLFKIDDEPNKIYKDIGKAKQRLTDRILFGFKPYENMDLTKAERSKLKARGFFRGDGVSTLDSIRANIKEPKPTKPTKPTSNEIKAKSIENFRRNKDTILDSLNLGIVPTDIQKAKADAKPKPPIKEPTIKQRIAEIDEVLKLPDLTESKITQLYAKRDNLVRQSPLYQSLQDSTEMDNYNIDSKQQEPGIIDRMFSWNASRKEKIKAFKTKTAEILKKIEAGELGEIPKKYLVNGSKAGEMWAKDLARVEVESSQIPEGVPMIDANGNKAKLVNGKWVEIK